MKYNLLVKCPCCEHYYFVRSFNSLRTLERYYKEHHKSQCAFVVDSNHKLVCMFNV